MSGPAFGSFDEATIRAAEAALLDPATRARPELVDALLHDDFAEIGRSGRRFTKTDVVDALAADPGDPVTFDEWSLAQLAPGIVVATYCVHDGAGASRHTSVWDTTSELPRLRLHQGTRVSP